MYDPVGVMEALSSHDWLHLKLFALTKEDPVFGENVGKKNIFSRKNACRIINSKLVSH